jgi:hypothetical protein
VGIIRDQNSFQVPVEYMIDSDQCPDSIRHPVTALFEITVLSKFLDLWLIYWLGLGLGHTSVTLFGVDLRRREMAMDLRIGCRFENLKKDIDLRIECRFENLLKGHRSEVQMSVT